MTTFRILLVLAPLILTASSLQSAQSQKAKQALKWVSASPRPWIDSRLQIGAVASILTVAYRTPPVRGQDRVHLI